MKVISLHRPQDELDQPAKKWKGTIRRLGARTIKLTPEEQAIMLDACVKLPGIPDRIANIRLRIPRFLGTDRYLKDLLNSHYSPIARQMRNDLLKQAIEETQAATIATSIDILADQQAQVEILREELKRNQEALRAQEVGSKGYMTVLDSLTKLKQLIDKLSGLARAQGQVEKAEDATIGLNIWRKKREIDAEFLDKNLGGGLVEAKDAVTQHTNLDEDLLT